MERRTCNHCGRDYAVVKDDALIAYNERSPWLDLVCKRCICFLRRYHKWTVTDRGTRICGECFLTRRPLVSSLYIESQRRKRELVPPGWRKYMKYQQL